MWGVFRKFPKSNTIKYQKMKILVLNCGSSSIKYQLFQIEEKKVLAKGVVEKIGMKGSFLKHEKASGQKVQFEGEILDHKAGLNM